METIYNNFEKLCTVANINDLENYIKTFNIDVNYNDGYFMEIICLRNDINLLKLFINNGANVHINNEGILRLVAHEGYITLLEYLINTCKSNYKVLYDSTAYFNKNETKQYIDNYANSIVTCSTIYQKSLTD